MTEEEKYLELRWYVQPCFKDSLAKCRFEQGSVIYKDQPIGKYWGEKIQHIDFLIQVQYPPRTMTVGSGDESEIVSNWGSEVIFDFYYPNKNEKKTYKTTQGHLFTFLWKNNVEILNKTDYLQPPLFITHKSINNHFVSEKIPKNSVGFAFVYNPINDIHLSKLRDIKKLSSNFDELNFTIEESCERIEIENELKEKIEEKIIKKLKDELQKTNITNEEIDKEIKVNCKEISKKIDEEFEKRKNGEIYPLQKVKLLLFKNSKKTDIYELIKKAVYKGKKGKFTIKPHGLLIEKK